MISVSTCPGRGYVETPHGARWNAYDFNDLDSRMPLSIAVIYISNWLIDISTTSRGKILKRSQPKMLKHCINCEYNEPGKEQKHKHDITTIHSEKNCTICKYDCQQSLTAQKIELFTIILVNY